MLAGRLRRRRNSEAALWTPRMATGLDAVLRGGTKPWAKYVALDTLDYIKADLLDTVQGQA
eukprot:58509-Alexandrium_andersonii.AAC.1